MLSGRAGEVLNSPLHHLSDSVGSCNTHVDDVYASRAASPAEPATSAPRPTYTGWRAASRGLADHDFHKLFYPESPIYQRLVLGHLVLNMTGMVLLLLRLSHLLLLLTVAI